MNKKFKHKWWKHLFIKYKVVEGEEKWKEYERFRNWFIILLLILAIVFSPIIVIAFIFTNDVKSLFYYDDGKDGRNERYTVYKKEEVSNE